MSLMNAKVSPNSDDDAVLGELAALGMRAARVVTRMMEIEQATAEVVASWLPETGHVAASLEAATAAGQGVDAMDTAMAVAVKRVEVLARAFDRMSRSVRRTVALRRRMAAGWTGAGRADDRPAMVRRQVARKVGEAIAREAEGDAAERLFDELAERLEEPGRDAELLALPVEEVVRRVCRDLGLAVGSVAAVAVPGEEGVVDSC